MTQPPLLCVEVLSPEDTMQRTRERVRDFLEMGVPAVWVVDPATRSVMICAGTTTEEADDGRTEGSGDSGRARARQEIFKVLDEY